MFIFTLLMVLIAHAHSSDAVVNHSTPHEEDIKIVMDRGIQYTMCMSYITYALIDCATTAAQHVNRAFITRRWGHFTPPNECLIPIQARGYCGHSVSLMSTIDAELQRRHFARTYRLASTSYDFDIQTLVKMNLMPYSVIIKMSHTWP
jgi:hypothetical protein